MLRVKRTAALVYYSIGLVGLCAALLFLWPGWTTNHAPRYWLAGYVKLITAVAAAGLAIALPLLVPRALALVRAARLSEQRRRRLEAAEAELATCYTQVRQLDQLQPLLFAASHAASHDTDHDTVHTPTPTSHPAAASAATSPRHEAAPPAAPAAAFGSAGRELAATVAALRAANQTLNAIIQASPLAIVVLDVAGRVKLWNAAAERIYGWPAPEVLGRPLPTVPPDREAEMRRNHAAGIEGTAFANYETRRWRKDGTIIDVSISTAPLRADGPQSEGVVALVADITARKRAEAALRHSEARNQALLNAIPDLMFRISRAGRILDVHATRPEELFMQPTDFLDQDVRAVLPPALAAETLQHVERACATGQLQVYEYQLGPAASARHYEARVIATGDDEVTIIVRNVTEQRRAAELLRAQAAQLQEQAELLEYAHVFARDAADNIIYWNNGAAQLFGWSQTEALGRNSHELLRTQFPAPLADIMAALMRLGHWAGELVHTAKDGHTIVSASRWVLHRDANGQPAAVLEVQHDITERKRAEEELGRQAAFTAAIANSVGEGLLAADTEGRFLFANPAAERMFGWTEAELRGQFVHDAIHYKRADGTPYPQTECPLFDAVRAGRATFVSEDHYVRRDGSLFPVALTTAPIIAAGQTIGAVQTFQDITTRRRAEQAERFLNDATAVLASSLDYELTLERIARLAVPYMGDICQVDIQDEATGAIRRVAMAHTDPHRELAWREMQRRWPLDPQADYTIPKVLRTGQPELYPDMPEAELRRLIKDEAQVQTLLSFGLKSSLVVPLRARGRTLGTLSFITAESGRHYDAAALPLAEELARRAALAIDNARLYQHAQEANRAKDEFLATLSHELRTPLTPIIGWTHMLRGGPTPAVDIDRGLAVIDKNSQALARLINDLLDMSAILSGKMRIDRLPVPLAGLLHEAVETVRPHAAMRNVQLELAPATPPEQLLVMGDRTRLVQVFWNLITNAVKFSPDGACVRVRYEAETEALRVHVEDDGVGLAPELLPRVFDRFWQADMSTTKVHGGLGIGLALVKSFVEAHGGTVRAYSAGAGHGSRFTVTLPRRQTQPAQTAAAPAQADPAAAADGGAGAHILLVEDAPDTLELLRLAFTRRGYRVQACADAEAALRVAAVERFDIIVSDIGLPHIDGYALLRRLRHEQPHLRSIPAVALTGYAAEQDVAAAHAAGYAAHVAKPVDPATLTRVLVQLLAPATPAADTQAAGNGLEAAPPPPKS